MEHTIAYLQREVEQERRRGAYLEAALRNYASHAWNDIKQHLDSAYPRSISSSTSDD